MRSLLLAALLLPGLTVAEPVPTSATVSTASGTPATIQLIRKRAGTYYLPVAFPGLGTVNVLLDTGSSHTVISRAYLEQMTKAHGASYAYTVNGTMADGSRSQVPVYRIGSLELAPGCWVHGVEAAVMDGKVRPILGMNVLGRLAPLTLSMQPASLTLHHCEPAVRAGQVAQAEDESPAILSP